MRFHPTTYAFVQRPLSLTSDDGLFADVDDFGYAAFVGVGAMSFLVIGHRYANPVTVELDSFAAESFLPAFPARDSCLWPPELMMDQQLVDTLFMRSEPSPFRVWVGEHTGRH